MQLPFGESVSYQYDALGRRVQRSSTISGLTTQYTYDGQEVLLDTLSTGNTVEYLNGPGVDNKLAVNDSKQGMYYLLHDQLGSVRAVTDATGMAIDHASSDSFGQGVASGVTRYAYTGREWDEDAGLYYYRARWYDQQQGRFISEDPIGLNGGINLYAYVENNPTEFSDPQGLIGVYKNVDRGLNPDWGWWARFWINYVFNSKKQEWQQCVEDGLHYIDRRMAEGSVIKDHMGNEWVIGFPAAGTLEVGEEAAILAEEEGYVNLASPERTTHILDGDATGGGHLWPGQPGKTPFPQSWGRDKIMHEISDIATDPKSTLIYRTGSDKFGLFTRAGDPARFTYLGVRDGVQIKVITEPAGEGIITGFPH